MQYFKIQNARQPVSAGGLVLEPEPLFIQSGCWLGVIATGNAAVVDDLGGNPLATSISAADYAGLKKNGTTYSESYLKTREEPVIPTTNPVVPAEVEKPATVEEVLVVSKAKSPPDSLSDAISKPIKTRTKKKK